MNATFRDIIVADDDKGICNSLSRVLEAAEFRVRTVADGGEAIEAIQKECPYFVITDWRMHPIDGIELCRRLRSETLPHYVYVLMLTAKPNHNDVAAGFAAGADDFVSKPVHMGELLARLEAGARVLELEHRLNRLASVDPLTGAMNRRTCLQLLDKEWSRTIRYDHPLSCVMWDLDHFKPINDTYGHLVGDEALRTLAQLAESLSRRSDHVCRWGGDEFLLVMPETDEEGAACWASRFCSEVAATTFNLRGYAVSIAASFGVAERHESMQNPQDMLDMADHAMYVAKKSGSQRVVSVKNIFLSPLKLALPETTVVVATDETTPPLAKSREAA